MFNLFGKNKKKIEYLFADLKPAERIHKFLEQLVLPELKKYGFQMQKSELSFKRIIDDFEQEIHFQKNRHNIGNEIVQFQTHVYVTHAKHKSWHKKTYGISPNYCFDLISSTNFSDGKTEWNLDLNFTNWYDLARNDNYEIANNLVQNLTKVAIPYMDFFSDKVRAIKYLTEKNQRYDRAPILFDFAVMSNDKSQAENALTLFHECLRQSKNNSKPSNELVEAIELRSRYLVNWA